MSIGLGRLNSPLCSEYGQQFLFSEMENDCQRSWSSILLCVFLSLKHYEKAANELPIDSLKSNFFNILLYSLYIKVALISIICKW